MSVLDPAMDAALASFNPMVFGAIEIVLPDHTLRLLDVSATVTFGGKTFSGSDATFGSIQTVDDISDGIGSEVPAMRLTLAPPSTAAAISLSTAAMQGSQTTAWVGTIDPATGQVIGAPMVAFLGELDVPTLSFDRGTYSLEYDIRSIFEDFLMTDNGIALSHASHEYFWPGETGLSQITGVLREIYWGASPQSGVTR